MRGTKRGGTFSMREIHDQYSEIAPESEKLKGRKHRRSGVGALPLAVCAFFAAGMFLHPYISVSGKAETVQAEILPESNASEDREVIAETEESRTQAEDIPEEESSTVHEESTQPETGLIEESTAPEETSSESTAELTSEETDTETVPETRPAAQQETLQTLPYAETQAPTQTETALQEIATEALPTENASQEESQTDPVSETEADAVPAESITESYAPDGSPIGTADQTDEESRAQSVTDGTAGGEIEPSGEGTIKESSQIPEESRFDTGGTAGQDTWESDASGTMGDDSDLSSVPTDAAAGDDSGADGSQEPDGYEPDAGTDLYYLESEPSDYVDNP
ncbi:MAG: hypothetical protein IKE56_10600 [Lachnospiraceae bacterium]|nr:hypothetical protein [Lachnospiraceae bacterium]